MTDIPRFAERRAALARHMKHGVAVIPTAPERMHNRDSDYLYRFDSYFYYLTGFTEPGAVLVLHAGDGAAKSALFCRDKDAERETWEELRLRFFSLIEEAAIITRNREQLALHVRCPSRPGEPVRIMSVREQIESIAAHDAYHFGRIVLLRQMLGAWPPASGGFTW